MTVNIPLILFAKAPVEGKVKTRLTPKLTPQQAMRVAEVLLEETVKMTTAVWPGKVVLAVWPDKSHPFIAYLLETYNIECTLQVEGDLGTKMYHAIEDQGYPCVVMGCDVPHCDPKILNHAYEKLLDSEDVIGLTHDGGYYLLGLQASCPALFKSVDWGSATVSETTLAIAKQHKLSFQQLTILNDIDEYADLLEVSSQFPVLTRLLTLT